MKTWRLLGSVVFKKVRSLIPATTTKYGIVVTVTYYAEGTSCKARMKHAFDSRHCPASSWYRTVNQPLL
jgi:hypothetical protein